MICAVPLASEEVLGGPRRAGWKLWVEKNAKAAKGARRAKTMGAAEPPRKKRPRKR
jgi:hypothetical protein